MLYRLIVNAAFLAVGYCIGREVGRNMASEAPVPVQCAQDAEESPTASGRHDDARQNDA